MGLFDDFDPEAFRCSLYASAAGFEGEGLVTAIAVAGGESSWNPNAINDKASETPRGQNNCASWGYWQINACPGRDDANPNRGAGNPRTLLDPWVNAQSAFAISSGGANWQPWGAYTSGAHTKYLPKARACLRWLDTESARKAIEQIRSTGTYTVDKKSGGSISIGGVSVGIPGPVATAIGAGAGAVGAGVGAVTGAAGAALGIVKNPLDALVSLVKFVIEPKNWLRVLGVFVGLNLVVLGGAFIVLDTRPELKGAAVAAATKNPAAMAAAS